MDLSRSNIIAPPLSGTVFGLTNVGLFIGVGDPNQSATDSANNNLAGAGVGSIYLRTDAPDTTHGLYVKTGATVVGTSPTGTWTSK